MTTLGSNCFSASLCLSSNEDALTSLLTLSCITGHLPLAALSYGRIWSFTVPDL